MKHFIKTSNKTNTDKSKRITKTFVELSIGVIGLLAVMISQLGAESKSPFLLEKLSGTAPAQLVFMLCDDLPKTAVSATRQLNQ